jgi:hypothetical protein
VTGPGKHHPGLEVGKNGQAKRLRIAYAPSLVSSRSRACRAVSGLCNCKRTKRSLTTCVHAHGDDQPGDLVEYSRFVALHRGLCSDHVETGRVTYHEVIEPATSWCLLPHQPPHQRERKRTAHNWFYRFPGGESWCVTQVLLSHFRRLQFEADVIFRCRLSALTLTATN